MNSENWFGTIFVIRRTGGDGHKIPLVRSKCLLGRADDCDIRIQLPTVSREHCKIAVNQSDQVRPFFNSCQIFALDFE